MKGGGLIAEGGYGCLFHPYIDCDGKEKDKSKFISKIQRYDFNSENEIDIGKIIRSRIPSYSNFFNVAIESCPINISQIKSEDKDKCAAFKRYPNKQYILLKFFYIKGEALGKYLTTTIENKKGFRQNIEGYFILLKSLKMLVSNNIVHFDIKSENILFDTQLETPIIIDFGLSIDITKLALFNTSNSKDNRFLYKYFYIYAPEYYIWAPEIHFINYLLHVNRNVNKQDIENIAKMIVKKNYILQKYFSPDFLKQYTTLITYQFNKYITFMDKKYDFFKMINKIIEHTWKTWDNFSLSIFYIKIIGFSQGGEFIYNEYQKEFIQLLLRNINPIPEKRLSIETTLHTFQTWINNKNIELIKPLIELKNIFKKNKRLFLKNYRIDKVTMKKLTDKTVRKARRR